MSIIVNGTKVTQQTIADALGIHNSTVSYGLKHGIGYIIDKANELGYVLPNGRTMSSAEPKHYYHNGNYATMAEETARMLALRAEGYSNAEIAKMIGRGKKTIWSRIGKGDPALAKLNRTNAAHYRAQRNNARKAYTARREIELYNNKMNEYKQAMTKAEHLKAELEKMRPSAKIPAQVSEILQ